MKGGIGNMENSKGKASAKRMKVEDLEERKGILFIHNITLLASGYAWRDPWSVLFRLSI